MNSAVTFIVLFCCSYAASDLNYAAVFRSLDIDRNDLLDTKEMMAFDNTTAGKLKLRPDYSTIVVKADTDANYQLSMDEFVDWLQWNEATIRKLHRDFVGADANGDQIVSVTEFSNSSWRRRLMKQQHSSKGAEGVRWGDIWWYSGTDDFGAADLDKNGYLSLSEFLASPEHFHDPEHPKPDNAELEQEFTSMDYNQDHFISLLEYNNDLQKRQVEQESGEWADEEEIDEDDKQYYADVFAALQPMEDKGISKPCHAHGAKRDDRPPITEKNNHNVAHSGHVVEGMTSIPKRDEI